MHRRLKIKMRRGGFVRGLVVENVSGAFFLALTACLLCLSFASQSAEQASSNDDQWTMPGKDFQNTRYSALDSINVNNAKNLKVAWTFSTGIDRGQEAAPLVVNSTMYVVTPYPNILYALDLA